MGVCQSYFGASTSGQGLTAVQLAACMRAAGKEARPESLNSKYKDQKCNDKSVLEKKKDGTNQDGVTADLVANSNHTTTIECQGATLEITSFAGGIFKHLRDLENISDDFFDSEWVLPDDHLGLKESEGRSRAMFLVSQHRCLLCKTVSEGEVMTLLSMLPSLTNHLTANPNSLLQRFVLALRIQDTKTKEIGWVVVFTDVFAKCPTIHEKWDLKGRKPKAAKYMFLPPSDEIPPTTSSDDDESDHDGQPENNNNENENSTTNNSNNNNNNEGASSARQLRRKQERKAKKESQKNGGDDNNNAENSMGSPAASSLASPLATKHETDEIDKDTEARLSHTKVYKDGVERVVARKDKELTRVFWVPKQHHAELQAIIKKDANYLGEQGILDYSILFGVSYQEPTSPLFKEMRFNALYHPHQVSSNEYGASSPTKKNNNNSNSPTKNADTKNVNNTDRNDKLLYSSVLNDTASAAADLNNIPCEHRTTCDGVELDAQSKFHKGIPSSASVEQYYVGIIDMLTSYTFLKKSANFWKNCLWNDETLSTVPPEFYRQRFVEFMEKCIVAGPEATKDGDGDAQKDDEI